jgi:hypothetical protein
MEQKLLGDASGKQRDRQGDLRPAPETLPAAPSVNERWMHR